MLDSHAAYLPNSEEVAAEVLDGEAVLINLSNGMYYSIDGVGGRIWELVEQGHDVAGMVDDLMLRYEVDHRTMESDLEKFIGELVAENLVVPAPDPATFAAAPAPDARQPYAAPELNAFRDMGDLLALDPPMPGLQDIPWKDSPDESTR